jgi:dUTP pyrophosphatase
MEGAYFSGTPSIYWIAGQQIQRDMAKVKIINKSMYKLPRYEKEGDAGMDIRWNEPDGFDGRTVTLRPLGRHIFETGIYVEIPEGMEIQIRPRSGLAAKHGITVLNAPGTIDAGFRSEIKVILVNLSDVDYTVTGGDRIAQMVLAKHGVIDWEEVGELAESERGEGGLGSTGLK